jgi:hypothetical protein
MVTINEARVILDAGLGVWIMIPWYVKAWFALNLFVFAFLISREK